MDTQRNTQFLIREWMDGNDVARDRLIARLLPDLEQVAYARLRRERHASLSVGDLVNDAVLRIMATDGIDIAERSHLMALASRVMRNVLVDHARAKGRAKRQHESVALVTRIMGKQPVDLIALNSALIRLGAIDSELASLVEMRFFGGMSQAEVAEVFGVSEATAKRRWFVARAWLADALDKEDHGRS